MTERVSHQGIIDTIEDDYIRVRILQTSTCAACKVAGHCNASEAKEKLVDVFVKPRRELHVGDEVVVSASRQMVRQALLLGFGLPFIVLVAVVFAGVWLWGDEGRAALLGLAALAVYYLILYMVRRRLQGRLAFWIED